MMTPTQMEQNILALAADVKRDAARTHALGAIADALSEHVARLETTVERLKQEVAALRAAQRGHGPSA